MQKKKIDELFQEKFLDYEKAPEAHVWNSIEASLNKKKKRNTIPIWWTLGGIAAAILIAFILFRPSQNSFINDTEITNTKIGTKVKEGVDNVITQKSKNHFSKEEHSAENLNETRNQPINEDSLQAPLENKLVNSKKSRNLTNTNLHPKKDLWQKNIVNKTAKPQTKNSTTHITANKTQEIKTTSVANEIAQNNSKESNKNGSIDYAKKNTVAFNVPDHSTEEEPLNSLEEATVETGGGKSIYDEIEEKDDENPSALKLNKWSAGPSVAPVYFNAIGEGSPVNAIFTPNSKSGTINLSYGFAVAYAVSKKLSIRSGIHKVAYGYDTNEVAFSSSLTFDNGGQLSSIDYDRSSKNLVISSNRVVSDKFSTLSLASDVTAKTPARDGIMSQQMGYLEVPMELNYAVIDNRFGLQLIGGVSSLFLTDNEVTLSAGELTTKIGEANNINSVNFSANMGFGMQYKFTSKLLFNLEPMFKYQLNTFSQTDGSFNPYSIGIYSGINFKF